MMNSAIKPALILLLSKYFVVSGYVLPQDQQPLTLLNPNKVSTSGNYLPVTIGGQTLPILTPILPASAFNNQNLNNKKNCTLTKILCLPFGSSNGMSTHCYNFISNPTQTDITQNSRPTANDCIDLDQKCSSFVKMCYKPIYRWFMTKRCGKSCESCTNNNTRNTDGSISQGQLPYAELEKEIKKEYQELKAKFLNSLKFRKRKPIQSTTMAPPSAVTSGTLTTQTVNEFNRKEKQMRRRLKVKTKTTETPTNTTKSLPTTPLATSQPAVTTILPLSEEKEKFPTEEEKIITTMETLVIDESNGIPSNGTKETQSKTVQEISETTPTPFTTTETSTVIAPMVSKLSKNANQSQIITQTANQNLSTTNEPVVKVTVSELPDGGLTTSELTDKTIIPLKPKEAAVTIPEVQEKEKSTIELPDETTTTFPSTRSIEDKSNDSLPTSEEKSQTIKVGVVVDKTTSAAQNKEETTEESSTPSTICQDEGIKCGEMEIFCQEEAYAEMLNIFCRKTCKIC